MIVIVEIELSDRWYREWYKRAVRIYPEADVYDLLRKHIAEGIGYRGTILSISYKEEEGGEAK